MPSPFPGMDPYLEDEKLWPAFQHQLISCLYQILLPGLVDRYRARVGQRLYVTEQARCRGVGTCLARGRAPSDRGEETGGGSAGQGP